MGHQSSLLTDITRPTTPVHWGREFQAPTTSHCRKADHNFTEVRAMYLRLFQKKKLIQIHSIGEALESLRQFCYGGKQGSAAD